MVVDNLDTIKKSLEDEGYTKDEVAAVAWHLELTYFGDYKYDCANNLCISRSWIPDEVGKMEKSRDRGCCGRYENGVDGSKGSIWIGFNYGH
tara:strand:- start:122 stop:397 length:276 start_codon:yes stop_codon:yes gene_type:complete